MMRRISGFVTTLAVTLATTWLVATALADEKKDTANATGTWTSKFVRKDGQERKATFKLKQQGEKLSGAVIGGDGIETAIEKATIKGDEISFQVTRQRGDQEITIKYRGKVSSDAIKGKAEFAFQGQSRSMDWEAKREAEKKK